MRDMMKYVMRYVMRYMMKLLVFDASDTWEQVLSTLLLQFSYQFLRIFRCLVADDHRLQARQPHVNGTSTAQSHPLLPHGF